MKILTNSGVYKITLPSGHCYIGSSRNMSHRWVQHRQDLINGIHHNAPLQKAWKKYPESEFKFSVLLICDKQHLLFFEQRIIDRLQPEYNTCPIAGSPRGSKWADGRLAKTLPRLIAQGYKKGRCPSEAERKAHSERMKGHAVSTETRRKIGEANKRMSPASRARMSELLRERWKTAEFRKKTLAALMGNTRGARPLVSP